MFDQLVESEPQGADFRNRRKYFMISSVVVGILFSVAVVVSIYAADYGLGNSNFELVELLTPVIEPPAQAPVEAPQQLRSSATTNSAVTTRRELIASLSETPTEAPPVSTAPSTAAVRPLGPVTIGKIDSGPQVDSGVTRDAVTGPDTSGLLAAKPRDETEPDQTPPPIVKADPPRRVPPIKSLGVINGIAKYLPKPAYSAAAVAVHAQGKVDVEVMIDESGNVTSASAISGHPLLRQAAVSAARSAKFTPTILSNTPVKVKGVIVYNFTR